MKKKYCSVYVRNDKDGPSCYYRVIQYINKIDMEFKVNNAMTRRMFRKNLDCKNRYIKKVVQGWLYIEMLIRSTYFLIRDLICKPKYVIIQREIIPRYMPVYLQRILEKVLQRTIVYWDFDDDIFLCGEISKNQAELLSKYSDKIIVISNYLKSRLDESYGNKVILLPTTDGDFQEYDINKIFKNRKETFQDKVKLVWVGTRSNIHNVEKIIKKLDEVAKQLMTYQKKQLILVVVCNEIVNTKVKYLEIENIKWSRKRAKEAILNAHIGIMPLINNDFSLGKGGFKLVQYISAGLPIIASRVGFNSEVVGKNGVLVDDENSNDDWIDAILRIVQSEEIWITYSQYAYDSWQSRFSYKSNLEKWKELLIKSN